VVNYRLGWIMIGGMSGALAGCGNSLQDLIEDFGDLRIDPPTIAPPTIAPPWGHPPNEPDDPGLSDAGATPGTVDVEPPVSIEPEPHEPPPGAADAGFPPVVPPTAEPEADAGAAPTDAGAPVEPPPVKPPAVTSFEADVWPIFVTGCNPCHTAVRAGGHSVGSADLAIAFADATRLGSTLVARLDGGGMPLGCAGNPGDPGCISLDDLATVQAWIDEGSAP
jgi:hypothetical protein